MRKPKQQLTAQDSVKTAARSAVNTGALVDKAKEAAAFVDKAKEKMPQLAEVSDLSVDVLRERRYLWTARAFAIVSAVAFCVNLVLLLTIGNLVPLKRVEPYLLTFQNKEEQVVKIQPLSKNMAAEDVISEAMIRQYVLLRNTMVSDVDEMTFRWGPEGPMRWMSSNNVFNQFNKTVKDWLSRIKLEGLTREVRIESVVRNQNVWIVYIVTRDMLPEAEEPAISRWRVKMAIRYFAKDQNEVKYINRLKNPLGFSVEGYSIESANE